MVFIPQEPQNQAGSSQKPWDRWKVDESAISLLPSSQGGYFNATQ